MPNCSASRARRASAIPASRCRISASQLRCNAPAAGPAPGNNGSHARILSSAWIRSAPPPRSRPRFLLDFAAGFQHTDLPLDFIFQRPLQIAKRIQILHFHFGAEFFGVARSRTLTLASQRSEPSSMLQSLTSCIPAPVSAPSDKHAPRRASAYPARTQFQSAARRSG